MINILYLFGGEKAQGAEIVIERLMDNNFMVNSHLILAPGKYADQLLERPKRYQISTLNSLRKLNRSATSSFSYLANALGKFFLIPIEVHQYIKKNNIQIVHTNTIAPTSYLIFLVIFYRLFKPSVKWIWSDHDLRYFTNLEKCLAMLCVYLYHRAIVVSEAVARKYKKQEDKVFVLYNGLDVNVFKPDYLLREQFRSRYHIQHDEIIVGIAAVINEDKGQLNLIRAFNTVSKGTNSKLLLAGNFTDDSAEHSQLVKSEIAANENIIYLGFVDHTNEFYNGCDVLVNNSNNYRSEALGTSIYEAMACEKIVLCANTGGTPEIIDDEKDGFLFNTESLPSLSAKLEYIFSNFQTLHLVQKAARRKVLIKFNIEKMVDVYNRLLVSL